MNISKPLALALLLTPLFLLSSLRAGEVLLVEDGKIVKLFSEPGQADNHPEDPFTISDADTLLDYLKQR